MRRETTVYYFTVEGSTEQWYLNWLQDKINQNPAIRENIRFNVKIERDPLSYVKHVLIPHPDIHKEIFHIFDYESQEEAHVQQFQNTLGRMKIAQQQKRGIQYKLGYSNFTFELWMVLHKTDCYSSLTNRAQYLDRLNRAYHTNFQSLDEYKKENNFKNLLTMLSLEDVQQAVQRARTIMKRNETCGYILQKHKGYSYYRENPSLSLGDVIGKILKECGLQEKDT